MRFAGLPKTDLRTRLKAREDYKQEQAREQVKMEQEQKTVTDYEMVQAMMIFGGSFVQSLGEAWTHADSINRAKLRAAFPEIVSEYTDLARLKRERAT